MKKGFNFLLITISLIALLMFPINFYGSLILGFGAIIIAYLKADNKVIKKVFEPLVVLVSTSSIYGFFYLFFEICNLFGRLGENYYNSGFYKFSVNALNIIDAICCILLFITFILCVIFYLIKKDVPLLEKIADKIIDEKITIKTRQL